MNKILALIFAMATVLFAQNIEMHVWDGDPMRNDQTDLRFY